MMLILQRRVTDGDEHDSDLQQRESQFHTPTQVRSEKCEEAEKLLRLSNLLSNLAGARTKLYRNSWLVPKSCSLGCFLLPGFKTLEYYLTGKLTQYVLILKDRKLILNFDEVMNIHRFEIYS